MSENPFSSGSSDEQLDSARSDRLVLSELENEEIEASRLADVLAITEHGNTPDLDPIEDPALASLHKTTQIVRASLELASTQESFQHFHESSRPRILSATPQPQRQPVSTTPRISLRQRWGGLFTPLASAAAASVATFLVTVIAIGGGSSTTPTTTVQRTEPILQPQVVSAIPPTEQASPPAAAAAEPEAVVPQPEVSVTAATADHRDRVNLTNLSIAEQVSLYIDLLERLDSVTGNGNPASEGLLRELAETGATVQRAIDYDPAVSGADAFIAMHAAFAGTVALEQATVATDSDQQVLQNAQVTAQVAYVTAARFLTDNPPSANDAARALAHSRNGN